MSRRWSMMVVAVALVIGASVVGEQTASACPTDANGNAPQLSSGRTVQVSHRGRNARTQRDERGGQAEQPVAPPSNTPGVSAAGADGYNLARVNAYRARAGLAPVSLDPTLTSFARAGSAQLMNDHVPHGHFHAASNTMFHQGFSGGAAENQGSPTGWPRAAADPSLNQQKQIDQILAAMMAEGPGGGHYDNMMNPKAKRLGIGLIEDGSGKLYMTNDFSQ